MSSTIGELLMEEKVDYLIIRFYQYQYL